jgi:epoxide hydrolase-like predicted phosphatase
LTQPEEAPGGAKGLLVDYGGVLTSSAARALREFEREMGLPHGTLFELIAEAYREAGGEGPIARVERGESSVEEFTGDMRRRLAARGHEIELADAAVEIFGRTRRMPDMWEAVRRAHAAGVRTALGSNSWGTDGYPMDDLREVFDELVISGEVGLRKPDPEIYLLTAGRMGLEPERCAFVDDLDRNVEAARTLGMFGVVHRDAATTITALEGFLGVDLRAR